MTPASAARGLARACHPLPAVAVTFVMSAFAWALGWRGGAFALLVAAILVGQLSVGWSNDAHDAALDRRVDRGTKPTVAGLVSAGALWVAAAAALATSCALSWWAAGWLGGSFHVLALAMAWLYNVRLSRTAWSWLPYAIAFGAMPAFLTIGLDGSAPPAWAVAAFAVVGVAGHLANAVPDIDADRSAGVDGLAVRLGPVAAIAACWVLLAVGTAILAFAVAGSSPILAAVVVAAYVVALVIAVVARGRSVSYHALMAVVAVDVIALVAAGAVAG
ncbi:MAG: UbiA family prenyltransferase [Actinomycetota bacterium]|nr:UbiA family prenyltransferase [Actinomycetota bacterium]